MDRRVFLLLTLAGAADPALMQPPVGAPTSSDTTNAPLDAPSDAAADSRFAAWRSDFMVRALAEGLPAEVVAREFDGLTPDPRILALQSHQPEFSKPVGDYVRGVVSDARVAEGQEKLETLTWLPDIETRFGVPAEILVAIWAVETNFGARQGDFDVLRALATLAAAGQRQDWAEGQLIAVLRIIAEGDATRAQLRGSWSGALGQTQFEPSQYLTIAVDGATCGLPLPTPWPRPPICWPGPAGGAVSAGSGR
jgi:membrane-bound lytic murein transglycosylase B